MSGRRRRNGFQDWDRFQFTDDVVHGLGSRGGILGEHSADELAELAGNIAIARFEAWRRRPEMFCEQIVRAHTRKRRSAC